MKRILFIISIALWAITFSTAVLAFGVARINVQVIDESGLPLGDTDLRVRFSGGKMPVIKKTDDKGNCTITSNSGDGVVVGTAIKKGYYKSTFNHDFYVTRLGMWQPWGKEISVVMRSIVNPVPMYVRNTFFKIPETDKEIGFDLMKADWVIPYGQGVHSDFIFKITRRYDDRRNYDVTLTLTFANPHDGIQVVKDDGGGDFNIGSWFRLPRVAPDIGYQSVEKKRTSSGVYGRHSNNKRDNNYIFRVRSEVDENGNITRAMYGKIRGDLKFSPASVKVYMHYYLNPDYTSNLEFDPNRNLFVITSPGENVTAP